MNDIVNTIEKKAVSLGAEILYSDNWGRKKLAYYIDKEKYGTYIFFQYKLSDLNNLKELSGEFEHNPNVLRYLNIKIAEQDIMKAKIKESGNSEKDENSSVEEKQGNTDTEKEN